MDEIFDTEIQGQENRESQKNATIEEAALFEPILSTEGWKRFEKELEYTEELLTHEPEIYAENNKLVDFDCGGRAAMRIIKKFILKQRNIIKEYVQEENKNYRSPMVG